MPQFNLSAMITVSAYTTVEAETLEEAISIAKSREAVNGALGGHSEKDLWIVDDIDGEPLPSSIHED